MRNILILLFIFNHSTVFATAEHLGIHFSEKGLQSLFEALLTEYEHNKVHKKFYIKPGFTQTKIPVANLLQNPIISNLREKFINIDVSNDLPLYVDWGDINVIAKGNPNKRIIIPKGKNKDLSFIIKAQLEELVIEMDYLKICEFKDEKSQCIKDKGLYGNFKGIKISLENGSFIDILSIFNINFKKNSFNTEFSEILTNLIPSETKYQKLLISKYGLEKDVPKINLSFEDFEMPTPKLKIEDEVFEIQIKDISDAILKEKNFIASVITKFTGEYLAQDFTKTFNDNIGPKIQKIKTSYQFIEYDKYRDRSQKVSQAFKKSPSEGLKLLNEYHRIPDKSDNSIQTIKNLLHYSIYKANGTVELNSVRSNSLHDLLVHFDLDFKLNKKKLNIINYLHNDKTFKVGKVESKNFLMNDDLSLVISESIINSSLDLINSSTFVKSAFKELVKINGVSLNSLKVHFNSLPNTCTLDKVYIVANLKIKLNKLKSNGPLSYLKNKIGSVLEDGVIWFPLQLSFSPRISKDEDGKTKLKLIFDQYIADNNITNKFNYPIKDMYSIVEEGVISTLKDELRETLETPLSIDLSNLLQSVPGINFDLTNISFLSSGHLVLGAKIESINLNLLERRHD